MKKTKVVAFLSDIHAPFHDRRAIELAWKILSDIKPDTLFFGGDIVDCYAVSDFSRDPQRIVRFQDEFDEAFAVMKTFMQYSQHGLFLPGNHELRWFKTLYKHPELVSLRSLTLPSLLRLDELNIIVLPHGTDHKIGDLYYMHGDETKGGNTYPARNVYLAGNGNVIFGHYHKAQVFYNRMKDGTVHGSFANPCLCELKQSYIKGTSQWQQGFSVVTYYDDLFRVDTIVFFTDKKHLYGAFEGRLYKV